MMKVMNESIRQDCSVTSVRVNFGRGFRFLSGDWEKVQVEKHIL